MNSPNETYNKTYIPKRCSFHRSDFDLWVYQKTVVTVSRIRSVRNDGRIAELSLKFGWPDLHSSPGLRSHRKNDTVPAPELFCSWLWLRLRRVAIFVAHAQAPASVQFYTLVFSMVLVCLKLNRKWNIWSRLHNAKKIYQIIEWLKLVVFFFTSSALTKGVRKGGWGKPHWAWYFTKMYYLRKGGNCFRILFLVNLST